MHHALIVCFFTAALCGGDTGLVSARVDIFTGAEGGRGTIDCYLSLIGSRKFFCKEQCEEDNILIKTDAETANSGRYSIKYKKGSSGRGILSVTIANMTKTDSGLYRCGLGKTVAPGSHFDFQVRVSDELRDKNAGFSRTSFAGETYRKPCFAAANSSRIFFCKDNCETEEDVLVETEQRSSRSGRYGIEYIRGSVFGLYVTIEQVTKADMGRYRCGYGRALSPDSSNTFDIIVIDDSATSQTLPSSSPSAPPASTAATTHSLSSTCSSASPEATEVRAATGHLLPLAVGVPLVGASLLGVLLLLLYRRKTAGRSVRNVSRGSDGTNTGMSVASENQAPLHRCEDSETGGP